MHRTHTSCSVGLLFSIFLASPFESFLSLFDGVSVPALLREVLTFGPRHSLGLCLWAPPLLLSIQDTPPRLVSIGPLLVETVLAVSIPTGALFVCVRVWGVVMIVGVRDGSLPSGLINN